MTTPRASALTILLLAALVGLLAGTHAAIWGMYKDALHEGFGRARFARSMVVGAAAGVLAQATLGFALPAPSALLLLFGVAYATERAATELWKAFVRVEDQSKYFIPMAFCIRGVPVVNGWVRLGAGAACLAAIGGAMIALARLDHDLAPPLAVVRTALAGLAGGGLVALGGAWKDAPKEGFESLKFLRSPAVTVVLALLLGRFADSYFVVAAAAIGFERAVVETWKKFAEPLRPPGKFAGKPVMHPRMFHLRRRFVPLFVAIWLTILGVTAAAFVGPGRAAMARLPAAIVP